MLGADHQIRDSLRPDHPALMADDDHYLILEQGDHLLLEFDLPADALPLQEAWVVAKGYYVPYTELEAERSHFDEEALEALRNQ